MQKFTSSLHDQDPLMRLLVGRMRLSMLTIILLMVAASAISVFGIGSIVSYVVHSSANIIRVFDAEHLYLGIPAVFVNIPIIWLMYLWLPSGIVVTLNALIENKTIKENHNDKLEEFLAEMRLGIDNAYIPTIVIIGLLLYLVIDLLFVRQQEFQQIGREFFWYYDKLYFFLIFLPVYFLSYYALATVIIKGVLALVWFNLLFQRFQAKVHPLHPDGAGGLGALGKFASKYGLVTVAVGMMATLVLIVRITIGSKEYADLLIFYAIYVVMTPTLLVIPLWSAHLAMVYSKNELLHSISFDFETVLEQKLDSSQTAETLKGTREKLDELEARHSLVCRTFPTWPVSLTHLKGFSIASLAPLTTSLLTLLTDFIVQTIRTRFS